MRDPLSDGLWDGESEAKVEEVLVEQRNQIILLSQYTTGPVSARSSNAIDDTAEGSLCDIVGVQLLDISSTRPVANHVSQRARLAV